MFNCRTGNVATKERQNLLGGRNRRMFVASERAAVSDHYHLHAAC
jgi:hypothetical protein